MRLLFCPFGYIAHLFSVYLCVSLGSCPSSDPLIVSLRGWFTSASLFLLLVRPKWRDLRNGSGTGSVLDLLIDQMVVAGMALPDGKRLPARLDAEEVRAIRASREKIASIASDYRISEAMVCKVRARACYKWVD